MKDNTAIERTPIDIQPVLDNINANANAFLTEYATRINEMNDPMLFMQAHLRAAPATYEDLKDPQKPSTQGYAFYDANPPAKDVAKNLAVTAGVCLAAPAICYGLVLGILKIHQVAQNRKAKKAQQLELAQTVEDPTETAAE